MHVAQEAAFGWGGALVLIELVPDAMDTTAVGEVVSEFDGRRGVLRVHHMIPTNPFYPRLPSETTEGRPVLAPCIAGGC